MDKRDFLKTSGAILTGSVLSRLSAQDKQQPEQHPEKRTNWAGNYTFSTDRLHVPKSVQEVQKIVASAQKTRALGARHSFNGIADSKTSQISLKEFDGIQLDAKARTVKVGAGVTYGKLAPVIDQQGFAVHNLASLPHISVVGACATGTHGSGVGNGNLSTAVAGMELVTADGELVTITKEHDDDKLPGVSVALGAMGVITTMTLNVQPRFDMRQYVFENLPIAELEHHLDEIMSAAYSVSLFTDWQKGNINQVWIKELADTRSNPGKSAGQNTSFFGAKAATRKLHPLAGHSAENCTEQMGIVGPWYERLPHFRMNFTPSSGAELQTEYFVPRSEGYKAIRAVEKLNAEITPHLFITELRTIKADDLWMSPAYRRDSLAIHFTWKPEWPAVKQILPKIEAALMPFEPRPHWAKLFTMDPAKIKASYKELSAFERLEKKYDPTGKFRNDFLNTNLFA